MDYNRLSDRVLTIINKYGTGITLSYFNPGTYSPTEGSYSGSTYTNVGTSAVFDTVSGLSGRQGLSGDALQTILEKKIDTVAYIAASTITTTPTIYDRVRKGGSAYEILYVEDICPANVQLLFTLFLRKG